jgi:hypothetical protein
MSYATGQNSFTSQCLLNIHIYCRFSRLCKYVCEKKINEAPFHYAYREWRNSSTILDLGHYTPEDRAPVPMDKRLGGPQRHSRRCEVE